MTTTSHYNVTVIIDDKESIQFESPFPPRAGEIISVPQYHTEVEPHTSWPNIIIDGYTKYKVITVINYALYPTRSEYNGVKVYRMADVASNITVVAEKVE